MFYNLDTDVKNIEDIGRSKDIASNTATMVAPDNKSWYDSELVNKKIRAFHDKYAAVPTDNCAREVLEKYIESLKNYLKSNNFCDRVEYTGNMHFSWHINGWDFHEDLSNNRSVKFSSDEVGAYFAVV